MGHARPTTDPSQVRLNQKEEMQADRWALDHLEEFLALERRLRTGEMHLVEKLPDESCEEIGLLGTLMLKVEVL